jgi:hypothetical protein
MRARVSRSFKALLATALACAASSGCQQLADKAKAAADSPIAPIVLKITHGALVAISAVAPPPFDAITELGAWGSDKAAYYVDQQQQKAQAAKDFTLVVVTQTVRGAQKSSLFKVTTDHAIKAAINGRVVETIQPYLVTIVAQPGTDSTIVITDANDGQIPFLRATVNLAPSSHVGNALLGDHSLIDLDTGADKNLHDSAKADLRVESNAQVQTLNGAQTALWALPGIPTLAACESLPKSLWSDVLFTGNTSLNNLSNRLSHDTWCVRSKTGRYGTISELTSKLYTYTLDYVLWKLPSDH